MNNIITSQLLSNDVITINQDTNFTIDKNIHLNILYQNKKKSYHVTYKINPKIDASIFIYFKGDFDIVSEKIICMANSILKKYKVNLNNSINKYDQKVFLERNTNYSYFALSYTNNNSNEVNQIEIFHEAPHSSSFISHKNLIEKGYIEVNCVGNVNKVAKESKVIQSLKSILLSKNAKALNRPILNIDNRNIIAKHSCAIGKINDDELYYLATRGFSPDIAKKMICAGYFVDFVNNKNIAPEFLKNINNIAIKDE